MRENLIVTYSDERAQHDKKQRKKLIDKAVKYYESPSLVKASNKRGGKKYIKETGTCSFSLDASAIAKDEAFDRYYAIETNELNLEPKGIINAYGHLWKIEESFRIMKTTMEVRPIFHWTEKRIKGALRHMLFIFPFGKNLRTKTEREKYRFFSRAY
ncbi:MAG: IS1634 family transposase [bacterium]